MGTVGFKTKAVIEQEKTNTQLQTQDTQEEMISVTPLQAETINRIENIEEFICSEDFKSLEKDKKQMILNDFAYYSKVSTFL